MTDRFPTRTIAEIRRHMAEAVDDRIAELECRIEELEAENEALRAEIAEGNRDDDIARGGMDRRRASGAGCADLHRGQLPEGT